MACVEHDCEELTTSHGEMITAAAVSATSGSSSSWEREQQQQYGSTKATAVDPLAVDWSSDGPAAATFQNNNVIGDADEEESASSAAASSSAVINCIAFYPYTVRILNTRKCNVSSNSKIHRTTN